MANPFDTLEPPSSATSNAFDQFDSPAVAPAPAPEETGDFMRGLKRTLPELKQLAGGTMAAAGDVTGWDGLRDKGLQIYEGGNDVVAGLTRPTDSATEAWKQVKEGNLGAGVDFLQNAAGYTAGQALESVAAAGAGALAGAALTPEVGGAGAIPGAVGGFVARQAVKRGVKDAAEKIIEKQVAAGVAKQAAKREAADFVAANTTKDALAGQVGKQFTEAQLRKRGGQVIGGALGAQGLNSVMELGSVYPEAIAKAKAEGRELSAGEKARAVTASLAASGLESAADLFNLGVLFRGVKDVGKTAAGAGLQAALRQYGKRAAVAGVEGAAREAGTEGAQTFLERLGAQQSLNDADAWRDYIDSAAVGAVGGVLFGGVAALHARDESGAPSPNSSRNVPDFGADPADALRAKVLQATSPKARADATQALYQHLEAEGRILPAPTIAVDSAGQAATATQRQQADMEFAQQRADLGLTPDVNAARAAHPAAAPNVPFPGAQPGTLAGAANTIAHATTPAPAAAAEAPVGVPGNVDRGTGEVRAPTKWSRDEVKQYLAAQLRVAGRPSALPKVEMLSRVYGLPPREAAALRREVVAESKAEAAQGAAEAEAPAVSPTDPASPELRAAEQAPVPAGAPTSAAPSREPDAGAPAAASAPAQEGQPATPSALPANGSRRADTTGPAGRSESSSSAQATPAAGPVQGELEQRPAPTPEESPSPAAELAPAVAAAPSPARTAPAVPAAVEGEGVPASGNAAATQGGQQVNSLATGGLSVRMGGKTLPITDLADAQQKLHQYRDRAQQEGHGASTTPAVDIVNDAGEVVAHFSYNGRIWKGPRGANNAEEIVLDGQESAKELFARFQREDAERAIESTSKPIDAAAHEAATSPLNARPEPTDAQKEAGNYAKGHVRIAGLDISIENPAGSKRRPEWPALAHHYGYIKGSIGKDKDHVDVFLTEHAADTSRPVFIVDQRNEKGGFDEHKVVLGAASQAEARKAYLANYSKDWNGAGAITQMTHDGFETWVRDPAKTTRPASAPAPKEGGPPTDLVAVKNLHGDTVRVRQSDLDSDRVQLPLYAKNGVRKAIKGVRTIHRENIDLDGSKQAARNAEHQPHMVSRPNAKSERDMGFTSEAAARRAVAKAGLSQDDYDVQRVPSGYVAVRKKKFETKAALSNATAPEHVETGEQGVTVDELRQMAANWREHVDGGGEAEVTHIFDAPAKGEVVRLADKVKVFHKDHGWMTVEQAKAKIDEWEANAVQQGQDSMQGKNDNGSKIVLSLFDLSGRWSLPWEQAGYQVFRFDIQDESTYEDPETGEEKKIGDIHNMSVEFFNDLFGSFDGNDVHAILAACPCTDFAVSGARHFAAKDADGRTVSSVRLVQQTLNAIEYFKPAVWAIENPVGRIESLTGMPPWRLSFDPNHVGDPYTKKTLIWGRFNGDLPVAPVEPTEGSKMHRLYGGKSMATKNARSETPEGFAYAFFQANNAVDHPLLAVAGKYDRLDRDAIKAALDAGVTPAEIDTLVEDAYYQDLDDDAANAALRAAAEGTNADLNEARDHEQQRKAAIAAEAATVKAKPDKARIVPTRRADGSVEMRVEPVAPTDERAAPSQEKAQNPPQEGSNVRPAGDLEGDRAGSVRGGQRELASETGNDDAAAHLGAGQREEAPRAGADRRAGADAEEAVSNGTGGGERGAAVAGAPDANRVPASRGTAADAVTPKADFTVTDELDFSGVGAVGKFKQNVAAVRLLQQIESEGRRATPAEQSTLAKFVGWGGLPQAFRNPKTGKITKGWEGRVAELEALLTPEELAAAGRSTQDAHYTAANVVSSIWDAVARLGFDGGRVLEPSMGTGNFFGLMPHALRASSALTGVELDGITGRIARQLYQSANVQVRGFNDMRVAPGSFDLAIGNPPFGSQSIHDAQYPEESKASIHNYFFAKSIASVRPGGVLAMVVSNLFLDANTSATRAWIAERASFLGAIRLPQTAFQQNAGTNVTTDIVFLQRLAEGETGNPDAWVRVGSASDKGNAFALNRYFLDHPDMMLGRMAWSTHTTIGHAGAVLEAHPGTDLSAALAEAVEKLPAGAYRRAGKTMAAATEHAVPTNAEVPTSAKVYGFYVGPDGGIRQRQPDFNGQVQSVAVTMGEAQVARVVGMAKIRDVARDLLRAEFDPDAKDAAIEAKRKALNAAYDGFVKANGLLSRDVNKRLFRDDPDAPLLLSLERDYDKGVSPAIAKKAGVSSRKESAKKAAIFTQRTNYPVKPITQVSDAKSAMLASLNERGRIDPEFMAGIYPDHDVDAIERELGDLVFRTPEGTLEPSDAYLSGNVKAKLAAAKAAAATDARFARNVDALERVIPADVDATDIFVQVGTPWIPASDYADFARETLEAKFTGNYSGVLGGWVVQVSSTNNTLNRERWGTQRMGGDAILEKLLENKPVAVYDKTDDDKRVLNERETAAAKGKAAELQQAFLDWLWKDAARRERLARHYNDTYNTDVARKYDGAHMTFPGMNRTILRNGALRPHQAAFAYRMVQDGVALADHTVGAGKTYASIAGIMEMRRLGLWRKPMLVVPNHLVDQWATDFVRLYPGANVLAATRKDFQKQNRRKLFARIATGDWDAVIVAHSSFGFIPLPADAERAMLDEESAEILAAMDTLRDGKKDLSFKQLQKRREAVEERIKRMADRRQDDLIDFGEMGVDSLTVDEAHEFKNLYFVTTQRNVAGLGSPEGSKKAFDLFVKLRHLANRDGGKNRVFLTGTPVSNTLSEVFHMQRYLQLEELRARGLAMFDTWAATFGQVVSDWEMDAAGRFKEKARFRKFANLPELVNLWRQVADTVTLADLRRDAEAQGDRFPVPKITGGKRQNITVPRSPMQAAYIGVPVPVLDGAGNPVVDPETGVTQEHFDPNSIIGRMENMPKDPSIDNHLKATGDARKASLDYRLVDPDAPDFPGSKINRAVESIAAIWKDNAKRHGTQLVFCDLSVPASARGKATEAALAKTPSFFLHRGEGDIEHVAGVKTTLSAMPDRPFFSLKGKHDFRIVEATSGQVVASGRTKQEAVDDANANLAAGAATWEQRFQENVIPAEAIDAYVQAWEDAKAAKEAEGATEEPDEGAAEQSVSMDELLADQSKHSVYDDMKAKLIAAGVPAAHIAFIHDYNTDLQKADLFAKVNRGEIRILFGSTAKMGAGMNVQKKLVALHHMDAPWRPSDLTQREGRILRQGNEFYDADPEGFEVTLNAYGTEQTYDARQWEIIETKAKGIEDFQRGDAAVREIDDISSEAASAADMKGAASGNPLILESIKLRKEVRDLEAQEKQHVRARHSMETLVRSVENKTAYAYGREKEIASLVKQFGEGVKTFTLDLGKQTITDPKALKVEPVLSAFKKILEAHEPVQVGTFRGLEIVGSHRGTSLRLELFAGRESLGMTEFGREDNVNPAGFVTRLDNIAKRFGELTANAAARVKKIEREAEQARAELKQPFAKADELAAKRDRQGKVVAALRAGRREVEGDEPAAKFSRPDPQTQSPAFRRWFGDSKVVDADGKPLVVYHGTASKFDVFGNGRGAIYFTDDQKAAEAYAQFAEGEDGPTVVAAYLRMEKPRIIERDEGINWLDDDGSVDWGMVDTIAYDAEASGFDGLILRGLPDFDGLVDGNRVERDYDQYVVFRPEQIKSATANSGEFDPASPNITLSRPDGAARTGGLRHGELERALATWTKGWDTDAPRVRAIATAADLPDSAKRADGWQTAEGYYDESTGTVYLVAANLRAQRDATLNRQVSALERAKMVLAHEAIGHYGMEAITGSALWAELGTTVRKMRDSGKHADLFAEIGRRYVGANEGIFVREAIAVMAEKGVRNSVIDRVVAAVRRFLRDVLHLSLRVNEAELRQLIVAAGRFVRGGARPRAAASLDARAFASRPDRDLTEAVPIVTVLDGVFGNPASNLKAARLRAQRYLTRLRDSGRAMVNADTGWRIGFSGSSIRELLNFHPDKLNMLLGLPRITRVAKLGRSYEAGTGRQKQIFHTLYAPVRMGDALRVARIVVREDVNGKFAYDFQQSEVLQQQSPAEAGLAGEATAGIPAPKAGARQALPTALTVAQLRDAVNAVDRPNWAFSNPAAAFHSALLEAVQRGTGAPRKADAAAWRGWLDGAQRRGEFRQSERDWLGLDAWLAQQGGAIPREALRDFVAANQVQVQDVVLGGPGTTDLSEAGLPEGWSVIHDGETWQVLDEDDEMMGMGATRADALQNAQDIDERADAIAEGASKFAAYQLPGGQNYRELLLTLPMQHDGDGSRVEFANESDAEDFLVDMSAEGFEDLDYGAEDGDRRVVFFDAPIPAGVMPLIERNRGAIVKGQDTAGKAFVSSHFTQPNVLAHVRFNERTDADGQRVLFLEEIQSDWHQAGRKAGYGERTVDGLITGVPNAPFKGTDEWAMLAFKRMVRWAAENGFDRVAWTTGEQQAARYDLAKHIDELNYNEAVDGGTLIGNKDGVGDSVLAKTGVKPGDLPDYIGKEMADRLMAHEPNEHGLRTMSGVELHVGGEGMRAFYDKILPAAVNKWAKRFGAKVGQAQVGNGEFSLQGDDVAPDGFAAHSLEITPDMRDAALQGLPLFSRPDVATAPAGLAANLGAALNSARDVKLPAGYLLGDLMGRAGGLSWWHKTVGTQFNLAERSPEFRRVFDSVQNFIDDVSFFATEAADHAPNLLPKLEGWKDVFKQPVSATDTKAISAPIFEGTLAWTRDEDGTIRPAENVEEAGVVWTDEELRARFGLNDSQIRLYREFRSATDKSLANLFIAQMVNHAGDDTAAVREQVVNAGSVDQAARLLTDYLGTKVRDLRAAVGALEQEAEGTEGDRANGLQQDIARRQGEIAGLQGEVEWLEQQTDRFHSLRNRGYAPLSRFGRHAVYVTDKAGEQVHFGLYDTAREANRSARQWATQPGLQIERGTMSEEAWRMFQGITPETLELFGDMLGLSTNPGDAADQAFQQFLKLTKNNRSAMKRLIHRKGIAGYSEDVGRVLAGFIYSNARLTSATLHNGQTQKAVAAIPRDQGELKDAAIKLADYVRNPQEEAHTLRAFTFAQYLGGSIAAAMVNMTQSVTMTFPFLSQYGGAFKAAGELKKAVGDALRRGTGDATLDAAIRRGEEAGLLAPQEIHQLMAQARGAATLQSGDGTSAGTTWARTHNALAKTGLAWGKVFSVAEAFNRRVAFIAAYRLAQQQGIRNPEEFAENAVKQTQGLYSKANKPRWARGAVGGTLFTFKQFSVAYVEMLHRMATRGGPEGKRAALLALGVMYLMAGASGLPGADDLDDLIDGLMQRLGYNFSTKQARTDFFASLFGQGGAQFLEHGISGLPGVPIDVSGRLGMGNLIPGTGLLQEKADHSRDLTELAGPVGDLAARAGQAANSIASGRLGEAALTISPVAVRNLFKGVDMATTGMYRDTRGRKVLDTNGYEALAKAIGYQPATVARVQQAAGQAQQMIAFTKQTEAEIAGMWAQGLFEKDPAKVRAARERLADWNRTNPATPIRIKPAQVQARLRAMRLGKRERLERTAPSEIRATVREALAGG